MVIYQSCHTARPCQGVLATDTVRSTSVFESNPGLSFILAWNYKHIQYIKLA